MNEARRYDTEAMLDLVQRSRHYHDRGELDMVDMEYLIAALEHYRRGYNEVLDENEQLRDFAAAVRNAAKAIVEAIDNLSP